MKKINKKQNKKQNKIRVISSYILNVKNDLVSKFEEVGVVSNNVDLLAKVVYSVLREVSLRESVSIDELLKEVKVIKPTTSDPLILFRERPIIWWL